MAKNSIRDYDSSSSNNSDVQSVDISEGCSPSGINNAIREVMADLADVNDGTVALESPKFDSIKDGNIKPPDASGTDVAGTATTIKGGAGTGTGAGGSIVFQTADGGSTGSSVNAHATAMTITDDGSIDINGNDLILDADGDSKIEAGTDDTINIISGGTTGLTVDSSGRVQIRQNNTSVSDYPASGAWTITGVPDWANKITLGTWRVSQASTGEVRLRVTVGGTAVSTGDVYKYTDARYLNNTAPVVFNTGIGTGFGANFIEMNGYTNGANLHNWYFELLKIDDYNYIFKSTQFNSYYTNAYMNTIGSIETTAAIDGFQLECEVGNFDSGQARLFWE